MFKLLLTLGNKYVVLYFYSKKNEIFKFVKIVKMVNTKTFMGSRSLYSLNGCLSCWEVPIHGYCYVPRNNVSGCLSYL